MNQLMVAFILSALWSDASGSSRRQLWSPRSQCPQPTVFTQDVGRNMLTNNC